MPLEFLTRSSSCLSSAAVLLACAGTALALVGALALPTASLFVCGRVGWVAGLPGVVRCPVEACTMDAHQSCVCAGRQRQPGMLGFVLTQRGRVWRLSGACCRASDAATAWSPPGCVRCGVRGCLRPAGRSTAVLDVRALYHFCHPAIALQPTGGSNMHVWAHLGTTTTSDCVRTTGRLPHQRSMAQRACDVQWSEIHQRKLMPLLSQAESSPLCSSSHVDGLAVPQQHQQPPQLSQAFEHLCSDLCSPRAPTRPCLCVDNRQ